MKKVSLTQLKENHRGKVIEISGDANLQKRLMNMGVYKGRDISKLSHIGLRGPAVIRVGRSIIALGYSVASKVKVEQK